MNASGFWKNLVALPKLLINSSFLNKHLAISVFAVRLLFIRREFAEDPLRI